MSKIFLTRARVIDGRGASPRDATSILIVDGRIKEIGATDAPADAEVLDLEGATVLPGIVNGTDYMTMKQVAQNYYEVYRQSPYLQLLRCVRSALVLLSQGVTTTVDIGAIDRVNLQVRDGIAMDLVVGPRVVTSGTPIEPRLSTEGVKTPGMTVDAYDAAEVRRHAEALVEAGVDFLSIKIDRRDFKTGQTRSFTREEVEAAGEVARAAGKRLHVLAREPDDIRAAIEAGASSISPAMHLSREPVLAREMAARGVFFLSSVSSWPKGPMASPQRDQEHRESLRLMLEAGVRVVPGIDLYGTSPVEEIVALTQHGMRPIDAIAAATRTAAEMLGLGGEIGTIEPGKQADLVVVNGDPSRDLEALRRVRETFRGGVRYDARGLERTIGRSTTIADATSGTSAA